MDFDKIITKQYKDFEQQYAFVEGNENILLIKVGQDGSLNGNKDKYLKITYRLKDKYGITTIVSSNHFTGSDPFDNAIEVVEEYVKDKGFENYNLNFLGYSNGALVGSWYGYKHKEIRKMLLINAPLSKNISNIMFGLKNYSGILTCVYGSLDTSCFMAKFILPKLNDKLNLEIIKGADHHFTGLEDELLELPEKFLFNDLELKKGR